MIFIFQAIDTNWLCLHESTQYKYVRKCLHEISLCFFSLFIFLMQPLIFCPDLE